MIVACPSCGTQLSVGEELAGHLVSCSQCSNSFSIPQTAQAVYVAPPSVFTSRHHREEGGGFIRFVGVSFLIVLVCCGGPVGLAWMIGKEGVRRIRAEFVQQDASRNDEEDEEEPAAPPRSTPPRVPANPPTPPRRKPEETVSATTLGRDYESNEIAADKRWKGRCVRVTGKVTAVSRAVFGDDIYVVLEGESFRNVQCFLKDSQATKAESLKVGKSASLVGVVDGLLANVRLRDSEIEN